MDASPPISPPGDESDDMFAGMSEEVQEKVSEALFNGRVQVVLAQKRTSLSVLRTGIGLLTLPMTIVAFLVTTSQFWDPMHNLGYLIPLFTLNTFLAVLGVGLIVRAWKRIRSQDRTIEEIKQNAKLLGYYIP